MAENNVKVLLGFEDELILDKHSSAINYTTNKIGGKPDWPPNIETKVTKCPLCELIRPLVMQIYAPLDNSSYHRTLYIFACINPNCWHQNESWLCLRNQILDKKTDSGNVSIATNTNSLNLTDWCQDADEWDDDNNANINEENGNLINPSHEHPSDDEDESCSYEEAIRAGIGHLTVDEQNANIGADIGGGAVGRQNSPIATAEIEGDESEVVTIDTPTAPQNDILALLQEVTPLPQELCQRDTLSSSILQFISSFISVGDEIYNVPSDNVSDHHIRDLLQEYQQNSDDADNYMNVASVAGGHGDSPTLEKYEKSVPAHGDKMFHHFLTRIQNNPGQILRYQRGGTPLLLYPIQDVQKKCNYCQSELLFEIQILPTVIPKLRLHGVEDNLGSRIEFGTVLVFSCSRSCWSPDGMPREEVVIVQYEKY